MKFLFSNLGTKIMALLASILFWMFLLGVQNSFHEVSGEIEVDNFNLNEEYIVVGEKHKVKIKVSADPANFPKLSSKDFEAFVNLDGLKEGAYTLPIFVNSKLSDVSVLRIEPSEIELKIEKKNEKQVPIIFDLNGSPAQGFEVTKTSSNLEKVTVKGGDNLSKVQNVKIAMKLQGDENQSFSRDFKVTAINNLGQEVPDVIIEPEQVSVNIQLTKSKITKTVDLVANLDLSLRDLYKDRIKITPKQIVIRGDESVLNEVFSILTEEVTQSEIIEQEPISKEFILPEGVELKDSEPQKATITFF